MATLDGIQRALLAFTNSVKDWNLISEEQSSHNSNIEYNADAAANSDTAPELIEKMLTELQQGQLQLERIRAHFLHQRNRRAKINTLPPEILRVVFEFAVGFKLLPIRAAHPSFQITRVCAYWRAILLRSPVIWTQIDADTLSKSKLALLNTLFADSSVKYLLMTLGHESERWSLPKLPGVEDLEVRINTLPIAPETFMFSHPAPRLRRLTLSARNVVPPSRQTLPAPLFNGNIPRLQHLHLQNICIPWKPGYCKDLVTLRVTGTFHFAELFDQGTDICGVLEDCPNLQVLDIFVTPKESTLVTIPTPLAHTVHLQRLRTLKLRLPWVLVKHLLHSIVAESLESAKLDLGKAPEDNAEEVLRSTLPRGTLLDGIFASIDRLHVEARWFSFSNRVEGWRAGQHKPQDASFSIVWPYRRASDCGALQAVVSRIMDCEPTIRRLELTGNEYDWTDALAMALRHSPKLRILRVNQDGGRMLPVMLWGDVWSDADGWPELEEIQMDAVLSEEQAKALLELCKALDSLRSLRFFRAILHLPSEDFTTDYVRRIHETCLDVEWGDITFFHQRSDGVGTSYGLQGVWPEDLPWHLAE